MTIRILLAQGERELRRAVCGILRSAGHRVVEAADGGQALELMGRALVGEIAPFDLVVSDLSLPDWSGLQLLVSLRGVRCASPVILVGASADHALGAEAARLGATVSPSDDGALLGAIRRATAPAAEESDG
jgi:DNA-binding response OmpR family regulator